jgi:hypothetical protein
MKQLILTAAALMCVAGTAWAHPGHGVTDPDTPAHYVVEPLHAIPVLVLIGGVALALYRIRSSRRG